MGPTVSIDTYSWPNTVSLGVLVPKVIRPVWFPQFCQFEHCLVERHLWHLSGIAHLTSFCGVVPVLSFIFKYPLLYKIPAKVFGL